MSIGNLVMAVKGTLRLGGLESIEGRSGGERADDIRRSLAQHRVQAIA
jgi:hypothetical protein